MRLFLAMNCQVTIVQPLRDVRLLLELLQLLELLELLELLPIAESRFPRELATSTPEMGSAIPKRPNRRLALQSGTQRWSSAKLGR
jgi:hypothetical protein